MGRRRGQEDGPGRRPPALMQRTGDPDEAPRVDMYMAREGAAGFSVLAGICLPLPHPIPVPSQIQGPRKKTESTQGRKREWRPRDFGPSEKNPENNKRRKLQGN